MSPKDTRPPEILREAVGMAESWKTRQGVLGGTSYRLKSPWHSFKLRDFMLGLSRRNFLSQKMSLSSARRMHRLHKTSAAS